MMLVGAAGAPAQVFSPPFNHETITIGSIPGGPVPNPNATDHLLPLGGYLNGNIAYYTIPGVATFDWKPGFNAVHMALIPKGPHQGKVLVWGATGPDVLFGMTVVVRAPGSGPPLVQNEYWTCTPWSIVDPAPSPAGPRFRNYLLPIQKWIDPNPGLVPTTRFPSLFCAGQAWSPFGDLIVAGGTQVGLPLLGATVTYAFNPNRVTAGWPVSGGTPPMYGTDLGLWQRGMDLQYSRFYPTVTLTARLNRLQTTTQPPREVAFVAGGSVDDASIDPGTNATWNNYEALVISSEAAAGAAGFDPDNIAGTTYWPGPGSPVTPPLNPEIDEDWLEDYPRMHLLSTGELFFSGYAPRWARVDHDVSPGAWIRSPQPWTSTNWLHPRHDGTSVLFPNVVGLLDVVMRIGGSDETVYSPPPFTTTPTTEAFLPNGAGGGVWLNTGDLPDPSQPPPAAPRGRHLMNVVLLPDASLLLLGGMMQTPTGGVPVNEPLLYNGAWSVLAANPVPSVRDYHSTAVLLPDGRVMLGGGNARNYDYEFFSPAYLRNPQTHPKNVTLLPPVTYSPTFTAFELAYATECKVQCDPLPLGVTLQKAVLIAPGACTHHSDMHQRYVEMATTQLAPNLVKCMTPADDKRAPRGIYMLFLLTSVGTIGHATWVVLQ